MFDNNGVDVDGDALSIIIDADVSNGTLTLNSDGSSDYTPQDGFVGTDSFSYAVSDGSLTDIATVTVTVNSLEDPFV